MIFEFSLLFPPLLPFRGKCAKNTKTSEYQEYQFPRFKGQEYPYFVDPILLNSLFTHFLKQKIILQKLIQLQWPIQKLKL